MKLHGGATVLRLSVGARGLKLPGVASVLSLPCVVSALKLPEGARVGSKDDGKVISIIGFLEYLPSTAS